MGHEGIVVRGRGQEGDLSGVRLSESSCWQFLAFGDLSGFTSDCNIIKGIVTCKDTHGGRSMGRGKSFMQR